MPAVLLDPPRILGDDVSQYGPAEPLEDNGVRLKWIALIDAAEEAQPPCRTSGWPDAWTSSIREDRDAAAKLCARTCPAQVKRLCLEYADAAGETSGVWGSKDFTREKSRGRKVVPA